MGALLADGIGDTIRVTLTADPVEEVKVAWEILKALGLRERGPIMIACPSCGRDNVGVQQLAEQVEERLAQYPQHFEVAVLGCAVNGPGEAGDADFGIAGGRDVGFVYAHGRVLKKVESDILVDELFHEIDRWIADGMQRPKRLKMAKPAALAMAEASADPARVACAGNDDRPGVTTLSADPARRAGRRRGGQPQAARARRLHPPGQRGPLDVPAARLAGPPQGRADHPRGDGRDRRAGVVRAGADADRALGGDRPRQDPGDLPRLQDRAGRQFVLPMTHEETFTFHARELQSYRELPQSWYHFQTKDRDEPRPRGGLLRVREFIMKDSYSFDRDEDGLEESFRAHEAAYHRIFERCGLEYYAVQAESGMMGGSESSTSSRRRARARTRSSPARTATYAADLEVARGVPRAPEFPRRGSTRRRRSRRRA